MFYYFAVSSALPEYFAFISENNFFRYFVAIISEYAQPIVEVLLLFCYQRRHCLQKIEFCYNLHTILFYKNSIYGN